jgi:hypothetical protein
MPTQPSQIKIDDLASSGGNKDELKGDNNTMTAAWCGWRSAVTSPRDRSGYDNASIPTAHYRRTL